MATADGPIARFKQPAYTGENRCLPCTVVNLLIAGALAVAVGIAGTVALSPAVGGSLALAVLVFSVVAIYLRGYLVPGTPELTKQYLPPWVLAWFGKDPTKPEHESLEIDDSFDPESALVTVGALEECQAGEDLCLTESFRSAWHQEMAALEDTDASRERLLDLLDADGDVHYEEFGQAFRARVDGQVVGKWESEAAFLADLGAAHVFAKRDPRWAEYPVAVRGQLLNGLRLFVDRCPACGGTPSFGAETVESCCSSYEVAAVTCPDCESRIFETPVDV